MSRCLLYLIILIFLLTGCAARFPENGAPVVESPYPVNTIIDSSTGREVTFDAMMEDLQTVRIIYVGEVHTNADHHEIQLEILRALHEKRPDIAVGMEMFARPYQEVLYQWSDGALSEDEFLSRTHWYANWRFNFSLYRDLLLYIKEHGIPLYGLNLEFHIPSKIAAGGIDSLLPYQKDQLPGNIDLTRTEHREYVKEVYTKHQDHVKLHYDFENFYTAQVVWDEVMAEAVDHHIKDRPMIVFAGNSHIVNGFGIPPRAYSRNGFIYRTVRPQPKGEAVDLSVADYIWITPPAGKMH
jgi:uncharacterized iron-regulated protein